ncbi:MAG: glycosyltransferase family 39 protein [bacterium]|nr:glycosyltransferase family 39 protein [bacterium]
MKNSRLILILAAIFFLAAFLRFYKLDEVPPGFHIDEVTVGYNAYSLAETGRDENGNFLPFYIDSFGDFRPAGYFYLTIPAIKIFGLNEFAVRFPSAFFGILSVILIFFLAEKIFKNRFVSFLSSFLLAISPWHLIVSRATSESSVALFLIMLGVFLFLLGVENGKVRYFFLAVVSFFASFYTYHTPRIFVPLLILGLVVLSWQRLENSKIKKLAVVSLALILVGSFLIVFLGFGKGRFKQVSIFSNPGVQLRLDEQIREEPSGANIIFVRALHNKLVNYGFEAISNYGRHFSVDFLFVNGGLPIRYTVPESGLLYLIELPFLLSGIFLVFTGKKKLFFLPVYWLLAGPVAASLTFEDIPNIQRAFFMLPSFQILSAYGFYRVATPATKNKNLTRNLLILASSIILIFNFVYFFHQYFIHQRVHRPWYRNYGMKELVASLNELGHDYQKIILTKAHNDTYIYILFYDKYDPQTYQSYSSLRSKDTWGFEKYVFTSRDCPSWLKEEVLKDEKILFVDKGECKPLPYAHVLKTIYREDRSPVFQIIEVDKNLAIDYFENTDKYD